MEPRIRVRVVNGKLELVEPVELPEGAEIELAVVDVEDALGRDERERLHSALQEALDRLDAGDPGVPAGQALAYLRACLTR